MPLCLLVDDDRDGREGYAEYLRVNGFEVAECEDAEAALQKLARSAPDILLLDLQLPGLSGWDLMREVRAVSPHVPIVAFSACVYPEDRRRAEEAGCDAFLTKPTAPGEVLAELTRLLTSDSTPGHGRCLTSGLEG
jgi:DNA-binding response OmpR family regulator